MANDVAKADLLRRLGFGDDPSLAEECLEKHGLSNPRKARILESKADAVGEAIRQCFMLVCQRGDCQGEARARGTTRTIAIAATQTDCEICGGSVIEAAVQRLSDVFTSHKMKRICIIGGAPTIRRQLQDSASRTGLELRLIDGLSARTNKEAIADLAWANVVVIWASTQLKHKATQPYAGDNVIRVTSRGIPALVDEVVAWVDARSSSG